jgi:LacI family transcriptional regulator
MATIRDVAKLAGVGIGTVSRVISGKGAVSQKTRDKVTDAMTALKFIPNTSAQSLSSKRYNTIGLWGTKSSGEMSRATLTKIERELQPFNVSLITTDGERNSPNQPNAARESIDVLINKGCDGLIIWGSDIQDYDILKLEKEFPNIVLLNHKADALLEKSFAFDHYQAGYVAGQYLVDNGHKDIAYITGWFDTSDANERHHGFLDALRDYNVSIHKNLIYRGDYTFRKGFEGANYLLNQKQSFTALFCANDQSAMSAISALSSKGVNIPKDISVMGYDNMNISSYTSPPLTTINVPDQKMAVSAVRKLINLCYGADLEIDYNFGAKLIERQSVIQLS